MQRYKTIIEYCGTNYHGMQKQSNYKTIQGELEVALFKLFQKDIQAILPFYLFCKYNVQDYRPQVQ